MRVLYEVLHVVISKVEGGCFTVNWSLAVHQKSTYMTKRYKVRNPKV